MSGDFTELRSDVELNTVLPEFGEIETRARRRRRADRFGNSVGGLGVLLLLLPALLVGGLALTRNSDQHGALGISIAGPNTGRPSAVPSANTEPVTIRLIAADGIDFTHLYGLTEVCQGAACDLQVISLGAQAAVKRWDIFRADPTQVLTDERMVALTEGTVSVSASIGTSGPVPPISLLADLPDRMSRTPVRPVQLAPAGEIAEVHGTDAAVLPIPHQPQLNDADLVCSSHGWWVTGTDMFTGKSSISVSRDSGTQWTTTALGVTVTAGTMTLATADGTSVYALARVGGKLALFSSSDGGVSWAAPRYEMQWGTPTSYGISVGTGGRIQVFYVASDGDATFMHSTDGGQTFVPTGVPLPTGGQIIAVPGGYVQLGTTPQLSSDGVTWRGVRLPYAPIVSR